MPTKPIKYAGRMYYDYNDPGYEVTLAHATDTKLRIDWVEDHVPGGIQATSTDGIIYNGRYSYEDDTAPGTTSICLYRSKDGRLFLNSSTLDRQ